MNGKKLRNHAMLAAPPRFGVAHGGSCGSMSVKLLKTPLLLEKKQAHFSAAGGTKAQT
jgi:hypothetical protein